VRERKRERDGGTLSPPPSLENDKRKEAAPPLLPFSLSLSLSLFLFLFLFSSRALYIVSWIFPSFSVCNVLPSSSSHFFFPLIRITDTTHHALKLSMRVCSLSLSSFPFFYPSFTEHYTRTRTLYISLRRCRERAHNVRTHVDDDDDVIVKDYVHVIRDPRQILRATRAK